MFGFREKCRKLRRNVASEQNPVPFDVRAGILFVENGKS
jgi:hypothetical protein